MNQPSFTTLGKLILETEEEIRANEFELDAGEVVYFDRFLNDWVPVLGGR